MEHKLNLLMISGYRRFRLHVRAYAIAKHLVDLGHNVTLMTTADRRRWGIVELDWDGVRTIECPDLLWGRLRQGVDPWNALHKVLFLRAEEQPYDLIHCFDTRPATIHPALFYKKRYHLPMVTEWIDWWGRGGLVNEMRPQWYGPLFGPIETYYEEAFRTRAEGLVVISRALAERAWDLGVDPGRTLYLPNGSWNDLFTVPDPVICRRKVGINVNGPIIGFSSMDSYLDMPVVMEALARVVRRYPDAQLLITGSPPTAISEIADTYKLQQNLLLTGFLPFEDLPWYLGCADLFVLPFPDKVYNVGRWPAKINGYMSVGRPTVTNPVGDMKTLFQEHDIGLLAKWEPEDFAEKIIFLLENPDKARELGKNARRLSVDEYDWMVLVVKLEAFYYKILGFCQQGDSVVRAVPIHVGQDG